MVLDTIEPLKAAIALYKKHGFTECEAYYHNPTHTRMVALKYFLLIHIPVRRKIK